MKMKYILSVGAAIFSLLLISNEAIGQSANKDVKITPEEASVQFSDDSPDAFMVEIGGPGKYYFKKTVSDTRNITIGTIGKGGKVFPDGIYKMQVTPIFSLTPEQREELSRLRANGDDEGIAAFRAANNLPKNVETLVINFSIKDGKFISPDLKEGRLNLPATSSRWELDHPALYASLSAKELDYGKRAMDPTNLTEDDQVIADDLIVQGSLCVGLDCVNNESFGFDTIRLKENNLRIKFEDTSVGSFPSNDWQLTANDSASGGLNMFSIDDITSARTPFTIEAGAPSNSLYLDNSGHIGLRTVTPVLDLHILTGNTPAIRLDQNGSSGFSAQTWDIAGNEANFFVRDVTNGSTLPFSIRPGAPSRSLDIQAGGGLRFSQYGTGTLNFVDNTATHLLGVLNDGSVVQVDKSTLGGGGGGGSTPWVTSGANIYYSAGKVSVGTSSAPTGQFLVEGDARATRLGIGKNPTAPLDVMGNAKVAGTTTLTGSVGISGDLTAILPTNANFTNNAFQTVLKVDATNKRVGIGVASPSHQLHLSTDSAAKPGTNTWTIASDRRLKTNIIDFTDGLDKIMQIKPVKYHYNGKLGLPTEKEYVGVIAQEMQEIAPYTIRQLNPDGQDGYLAYDGSAVTFMLINAVKEQQAIIETQQQEIAKLKNELAGLAALKQAVAELTQMVKGQQGTSAPAARTAVSEKE